MKPTQFQCALVVKGKNVPSPFCGETWLAHDKASLIEQRFGLLQVQRIKAFRESVVNWSEKIVGLPSFSLIAPQPHSVPGTSIEVLTKKAKTNLKFSIVHSIGREVVFQRNLYYLTRLTVIVD
jgi:hypothetical protein